MLLPWLISCPLPSVYPGDSNSLKQPSMSSRGSSILSGRLGRFLAADPVALALCTADPIPHCPIRRPRPHAARA